MYLLREVKDGRHILHYESRIELVLDPISIFSASVITSLSEMREADGWSNAKDEYLDRLKGLVRRRLEDHIVYYLRSEILKNLTEHDPPAINLEIDWVA